MGQQVVASGTWRAQNRHISQGFYESVGQQSGQTVARRARLACAHVKTLNQLSADRLTFLGKTKGIGLVFSVMGRLWLEVYSRLRLTEVVLPIWHGFHILVTREPPPLERSL